MTNVGTLYNVHHIGKCRGTKWQVELGLLEGSQTSVVDLDPDPVFLVHPEPDPVFLGHSHPDPGKYRIQIL